MHRMRFQDRARTTALRHRGSVLTGKRCAVLSPETLALVAVVVAPLASTANAKVDHLYALRYGAHRNLLMPSEVFGRAASTPWINAASSDSERLATTADQRS